MHEWGATWKRGTKMAKAMNPWPSGGRSSWTRAPVGWIVDVFEMEKGGHVPVTVRKRLKRRVDLDDWAPFDEDAVIPKQFRACMPEDPEEDEVIRGANGDEEGDESDESDDEEGQERKRPEPSPVDTETEDSEDEEDGAPLTSIKRKAKPKRKPTKRKTKRRKKAVINKN